MTDVVTWLFLAVFAAAGSVGVDAVTACVPRPTPNNDKEN